MPRLTVGLSRAHQFRRPRNIIFRSAGPGVCVNCRLNPTGHGPPAHNESLTLHQPWASLIADGRKTIETRSWPPPRGLIGDRIAIHAGKRIDLHLSEKWFPGEHMPLGAIICTARIDDVAHVEYGGAPFQTLAWWCGRQEFDRVPIDEFGDFSLGRYLWKLAAVKEVSPVVHVRGRQRLWDWAPR